MAEYIERESIKKSINSLLDMVLKFTHSPIEIKQLIFDVIDEERAADVQPIIYAHKAINVGRRSYCSNCGKLAIMEDFCSKCGAEVKDDEPTRNLKLMVYI